MAVEQENIDFIKELKRLASLREPRDSMRFYRRMEETFAEETKIKGGLLPYGPTGEVWMSTSLKHSRAFENQVRTDHDLERVVVFRYITSYKSQPQKRCNF